MAWHRASASASDDRGPAFRRTNCPSSLLNVLVPGRKSDNCPGTAATSSVSADPFLMAVAIGASSAFLTPIGHQSNTLVLGPGGYKFGDYWPMGLPLQIIIIAVAVPLLLVTWPL